MKLEEHVLSAIQAFDRNKKDEALMHASIAIDGTSRKLFSKQQTSNKDYKSCIRQYWWIIERFIGDGINLEETQWTNVKLDNGHGKLIINPDLADIIYHIFRCSHVHGKEIPIGYELLPAEDGLSTWVIGRDSRVHMPERIIWALLAVSVFCKANSEIKTDGEYYLSWGSEKLGIGITKFVIKDWWGREDDLRAFFSERPCIRIKLEGF